MMRSNLGLFGRSSIAAVAVMFLASGTANAGWFGWHGSSGGSYGSHGSYGSYGSYGSHGGLFSRFHCYRPLAHRSYGSYGSHGSSGGGYRSYGSSGGSSGGSYGSSGGSVAYYGGSSGGGSSGGSYGSYRSYGSSGGSAVSYGYGSPSGAGYGTPGGYGTSPYYTTPSQGAPLEQSAKPQTENGDLPPAKADGNDQAILSVQVPADAIVYVNGMKTRSTGELRRYVSRGLEAGMTYTYDVKVEVARNGKTLEDTKSIQLTAGVNSELAFSFAKPEVETTLTLNVPENATVRLAGNVTNMTGATRVFKTKALSEGDVWENYKVVVSIERDGNVVSQEKTISLAAGDVQSVDFDFNSSQVAANQ